MAQFMHSTRRTGRAAQLAAAEVVLQVPATAERQATEVAQINSTAEDLHILLGAYVLGALSDKDNRAFRAHLRSCAPCQAELDELVGITRLLDLLDPAVVEKPA